MNTRRGRPAELPVDTAPWGGPLNLHLRGAWLLRVTRMTSPDLRDLPLSAIAGLLASYGVRADAARLSGWESGRDRLTPEVVQAYERLLDLTPGHLLGPLCRLGAVHLRSRGPNAPTQARLDALLAPVFDGRATGVDWLEAARLLSVPGLHIPSRLFNAPAAQLVSETMRGVGPAFSIRTAALRLLVAESPLANVVVDQVVATTLAEHAQTVVDAVGTLAWSHEPRHVDHAVTLLDHPNPRVQEGVAIALAERRWVVGLPGSSSRQLALVRDRWTSVRRPRLDVVASLLELTAVPRPSGRPPRGSGTASDLIRRTVRAGREVTGIATDPMFERLVREAMLDPQDDHRNLANLLLSQSPYRAVVAAHVCAGLDEEQPPGRQAALCETLQWVATAAQSQWLLDRLHGDDATLAATALVALAHSSGVPDGVDLTQLRLPPADRVRLITYAAGMSGHRQLASLARDGSDQRGPARWWLRHGQAVQV